MKNNSSSMNEWQCSSMTSLKDIQFLADFHVSTPKDRKQFKIYYFLSQPLIFGSEQKGVMSFIVTGYAPTDDFPELNRNAMISCLDHSVRNGTINYYRLKEIDSGSVRVSMIYSINTNESFGEKMVKTFIEVFRELNVQNGLTYKNWIEQMTFACENYHYVDGIWLTSKDYFSSKLELLQPEKCTNQAELYRADIKDLF